MATLYMFGNGFDIAHEIYTPYSEFRKFLKKEHETFLTRFEEMYNIQPLDDTEPWYSEAAQKRWDESVLKNLWKTFEEDIGHPNVDEMYDRALSLVDSMPSEGIKDTLDAYWREEYGFSHKLQKYVLEWLESIDTSSATAKKDILVNNQEDLFINFNYTDTLERVYGIDNVLHIHGGVSTCADIPPIMGHGNKYLISSFRCKAKKYQEEFNEWAESICNAIADYGESILKDSEKIIRLNEEFFTSIRDVQQVVCLGLSFGDVDIPYLNKIKEEVPKSTKWLVYYYGDESHRRLKDVFGITGISCEFEVYFLPSDKFWDR